MINKSYQIFRNLIWGTLKIMVKIRYLVTFLMLLLHNDIFFGALSDGMTFRDSDCRVPEFMSVHDDDSCVDVGSACSSVSRDFTDRLLDPFTCLYDMQEVAREVIEDEARTARLQLKYLMNTKKPTQHTKISGQRRQREEEILQVDLGAQVSPPSDYCSGQDSPEIVVQHYNMIDDRYQQMHHFGFACRGRSHEQDHTATDGRDVQVIGFLGFFVEPYEA